MAKTKIKTLVALLALYVLMMPTPTVLANEIKVDTHCTLIEAIGSANNDSSKARCETGWRDDIIILKKNVTLDRELPVIKSNITIEGNGYAIFVKQKNPAFTIRDGSLTIKNLRVKFRGENRSGPSIDIRNGSITIIDSKMQNCSGKFQIEKSQGLVRGNDYICGYKPATVNSWFHAAPAPAGAEPAPAGAAPEPAPAASYPSTCQGLPGHVATVTATYGLGSGLQCQRVDALGIGIQSVIEAGFIDAVDLWGYVEQGVEICFPQPGAITFLDSTTIPRSIISLEAYSVGGSTCVALDRPGTVVLIPGQSPPRAQPVIAPAQPQQPAAQAPVAAVEPPTEQCQVTLTGHLRHRATPAMGDNIIGYVARGSTLPRLSSTRYWVQVEYRGQVGWIIDSPRYIVYSGACG